MILSDDELRTFVKTISPMVSKITPFARLELDPTTNKKLSFFSSTEIPVSMLQSLDELITKEYAQYCGRLSEMKRGRRLHLNSRIRYELESLVRKTLPFTSTNGGGPVEVIVTYEFEQKQKDVQMFIPGGYKDPLFGLWLYRKIDTCKISTDTGQVRLRLKHKKTAEYKKYQKAYSDYRHILMGRIMQFLKTYSYLGLLERAKDESYITNGKEHDVYILNPDTYISQNRIKRSQSSKWAKKRFAIKSTDKLTEVIGADILAKGYNAFRLFQRLKKNKLFISQLENWRHSLWVPDGVMCRKGWEQCMDIAQV